MSFLVAQPERAAQRIGLAKIETRRGVADDRHFCGAGTILVGKGTARSGPCQTLEIFRSDYVRRYAVETFRIDAGHEEPARSGRKVDRAAVEVRSGLHPGQLVQAVEQVRVEACPANEGQFRSARIQIEQHNVLSFKARFERVQVTKASDEQARRADDQHTERDLRNDQRVPVADRRPRAATVSGHLQTPTSRPPVSP